MAARRTSGSGNPGMITVLVGEQEILPRLPFLRPCTMNRDRQALRVEQRVHISIRYSLVIALQLPRAKPREHLDLDHRGASPIVHIWCTDRPWPGLASGTGNRLLPGVAQRKIAGHRS